MLLENEKIDMEARWQGLTPLFIASQHGHAPVVAQLLKKGANWRETCGEKLASPIHVAAEMGHAEVVEVMIASSVDLNARLTTGATPLFLAAQKGYALVVNLLAKSSATKINLTRNSGETALMIAAQNGLYFV